ncbi:hypothetical protein ACVWZV_009383 [Bradyrhizobium sp. GM5.1]
MKFALAQDEDQSMKRNRFTEELRISLMVSGDFRRS